MDEKLGKLYDSFKLYIKELKIFNNIDEIFNDKHKKNAIVSMN